MRRAFGIVVGLVAAGGALACGPSFQAIYEGNVRFEHCYALEENAQKGMHEKSDCWRDWSEHYTYGQTRDRIHYATARYVALSQSTSVPTDEAMMMAAPGMTPRQSTITAPAPTNAFAPPPKILDEADAGWAGRPVRPSDMSKTVVFPGGTASGFDASASAAAIPPAAGASSVRPPASDCTDPCTARFRDCKGTCAGAPAGDAGKDAPCTLCEKTYRTCMRACFK